MKRKSRVDRHDSGGRSGGRHRDVGAERPSSRGAGAPRGLEAELERLDGRGYPAYKDLWGARYPIESTLGDPWRATLAFDHVQGDPFAAPSRLRVELDPDAAGLPVSALAGPDARRAAADFVHRALRRALSEGRPGRGRGSGKSGLIEIAALGQEVLERSAVRIDGSGGVAIRLVAGLPAQGRRILGREAARMLCRHLPEVLALAFLQLDVDALEVHVRAVEDQVALRAAVDPASGLLAFVADGAILPRRSGVDMRPLESGIPFASPPPLRVELRAPHAGLVSGLGLPRGVSLIVGGGYHGKTTLLQALACGVYDHVPGDGRERCVTASDAVSIRAEDGRSVRGVDLRPFIRDLPGGRRTDRFDTDDASGSTSQAAAIVEALEVGASALLIDEDTAATNFMIRDARMRRLIPSDAEPITPFLDRVRQLHDERGVSSVLVIGGAGDYLDVADTVIQMNAYRPEDVTERAREVADALPLRRDALGAVGEWPASSPRIPQPDSLDPSRGRRSERVRSVKTRAIEFGEEEIDLSALVQLVDPSQARGIADALLALSKGGVDGMRSVPDLLDWLDQKMQGDGSEGGLEGILDRGFGDRARPRRCEIAAALNRLRSLRLC